VPDLIFGRLLRFCFYGSLYANPYGFEAEDPEQFDYIDIRLLPQQQRWQRLAPPEKKHVVVKMEPQKTGQKF